VFHHEHLQANAVWQCYTARRASFAATGVAATFDFGIAHNFANLDCSAADVNNVAVERIVFATYNAA
jgi:hypothetical protein